MTTSLCFVFEDAEVDDPERVSDLYDPADLDGGMPREGGTVLMKSMPDGAECAYLVDRIAWLAGRARAYVFLARKADDVAPVTD